MKKIVGIILLLVILGGAGYYWKSKKAKVQEVKIGLLLPLTGEMADYGTGARNAAMMAINKFNAKQSKIKVTAVEMDQKGDNEETKKIVQGFLDDPAVMGMIGPINSGAAFVATDMLNASNKGMTIISPTATNEKLSGYSKYFFRTCPSDSWQGVNLGQFVINDLKFKDVAILYQEDEPYSKGLAEIFGKEIQTLGGNIVDQETYLKGADDFSKQLIKIKAKNPQLIFVPGYTQQGVRVNQQMKQLGMNNIQFLGGDGIEAGEIIKMGGSAVEGIMGSSFFDVNSTEPIVQVFVTEFNNSYGRKLTWMDVNAYDATGILLSALENTKTMSRAAVRDLVAKTTDYPGISGSITFDNNGDPLNKNILKMKVVGGKWILFKK